jgi:branched-subunit amino acid aminotransferase/4-amino-4-deoxychorismate lyase
VTLAGQERRQQSSGADVAVAESFLVSDGRVRGLDLHWERFRRGCAAARITPSAPPATVVSALPVSGRWFPRVEVLADGELRTAVRPAPPREPEVTAWVCESDPRRAPRRKGPDLARLSALRAQAARHAAGEALLCDDEGRLLEGAYTSLLWWEGDVLWAVPDDAPILDGVTRRLLLDLAVEHRIEVRFRCPTPASLEGREVWLTSALHGIRAVTSSTAPGCVRAGPAPRAPAWQARLEALAAPIGR